MAMTGNRETEMPASTQRADWLKPLRNAGVLGLGRAGQGVLSLASMAVTARALGVHDFGALMLIHGFMLTVADIAKFQSWQTIVRYGAAALQEDDHARLQRTIGFALRLDLIAALTGLAVIWIAAGPAATLFGLNDDVARTAALYGCVIVFVTTNFVPIGLLRLLDRFDLLAAQTQVSAGVRLTGAVVLLVFQGDLNDFLMLWFVSVVAGSAAYHGLAWSTLARSGLAGGLAARLCRPGRAEPGLWRFVLHTNVAGTLAMLQTRVGLLAVGWLLGPAAAGLYQVARQIADVLVKSNSKLLTPAIYPELARLSAPRQAEGRRLMVRRNGLLAAAAAACVFALLALFGRDLIAIAFSASYLDAYTTMLWLALAGLISLATFPLEPLLFASGWPRAVMVARLVAAVAYLTLLYLLLPRLGLEGAGIAATAGAALGAVLFGAAARAKGLIGRNPGRPGASR